MGIDSKHPSYTDHIDDWILMRDSAKSERHVKDKGTQYLPATSGMIEDGLLNGMQTIGGRAYDAYRKRARFPDLVKESIEALLGVMHNKPPKIDLPEQLESIRERATFRNESLEMLLRRINEEQIHMGRLGLLGDIIDSGERAGEPYIALYEAEDIINWDEGQMSRDPDSDSETGPESGEPEEVTEPENLNLVVLDETGPERIKDFEWRTVQKYRVLVFGDPLANEPEGEGTYRVGMFRDTRANFDETKLVAPAFSANRTIDEIPFVFINTKDVVPEPDDPPLLGVANDAMGIYRGEADYRQALFMQGQDTLVVIGAGDLNKRWRIGAGASINLPAGGDAKFIGISAEGIAEMRSALDNDYKRAAQRAGRMLEATSREAESGEALQIRVAARTATLNQIALTGAFGLELMLKKLARWMGADETQVRVEPNLDFVDDKLLASELVELITARTMGGPLSLETIHDIMRERGLTKKTFEEELADIESEQALELGMGSTNPDGPVEDDEVDDEGEAVPAGAGGARGAAR